MDCECLLTVRAVEAMSVMLIAEAAALTSPVAGVPRQAQLESAELLAEVAEEVFDKAQSLLAGQPAPVKDGRILGAGVSGTMRYSFENIRRLAETAKDGDSRDEPLLEVALTLSGLSKAFQGLGDRLAVSCVTGKKAF